MAYKFTYDDVVKLVKLKNSQEWLERFEMAKNKSHKIKEA